MDFTPPSAEQVFALKVSAGIEELAADPETVAAIVEGIGSFAAGEWAPLNRIGDVEGARLADGVVMLPEGFADAWRGYVEAGWNTLSARAARP
jgi:hypothetical protein